MNEYKGDEGENQTKRKEELELVHEMETTETAPTKQRLGALFENFLKNPESEEGVDIIQEIARWSNDRQYKEIFFSDEEQPSFALILLSMFKFEPFVPHILIILTNLLSVFNEENDYSLHYALILNEEPPIKTFFASIAQQEDLDDIEQMNEFANSADREILMLMVRFLNELSKPELEAKNNEMVTNYWCCFSFLLLSIANIEDNEELSAEALHCVSNIILKTADIRFTFVNQGIIPICLREFEKCSLSFPYVCKIIGKISYLSSDNLAKFPDNIMEVFGTALQQSIEAPENSLCIIDMLNTISSSLDGSRLMLEKELHTVIIDFVVEAPYKCREKALILLKAILTDTERNYETFAAFLLESENLDFFMPFLETENERVEKIVANALSHVITRVRLNQEVNPEALPLLEVF
jgi:hypothetical protein